MGKPGLQLPWVAGLWLSLRPPPAWSISKGADRMESSVSKCCSTGRINAEQTPRAGFDFVDQVSGLRGLAFMTCVTRWS